MLMISKENPFRPICQVPSWNLLASNSWTDEEYTPNAPHTKQKLKGKRCLSSFRNNPNNLKCGTNPDRGIQPSSTIFRVLHPIVTRHSKGETDDIKFNLKYLITNISRSPGHSPLDASILKPAERIECMKSGSNEKKMIRLVVMRGKRRSSISKIIKYLCLA